MMKVFSVLTINNAGDAPQTKQDKKTCVVTRGIGDGDKGERDVHRKGDHHNHSIEYLSQHEQYTLFNISQ